MTPKVLLSDKKINIILNRLCYQLIERHGDLSNAVLVGLQPRGTFLLDRLVQLLIQSGVSKPKVGKLDTTFFRDDFRRSERPLNANATEMNESIEGKDVVLIDDVLFTGRSIRSALTAIDTYGRPESYRITCPSRPKV